MLKPKILTDTPYVRTFSFLFFINISNGFDLHHPVLILNDVSNEFS